MAIEKTMLDALMNGESTEVEIPEEMGEVLPENIIIEGEEETDIAIVPDPIEDFNENLAEVINESDLRALCMDLTSDFDEDEESRREWLETFTNGLDLLGIKTEDRSEPFPGASGVHHPLGTTHSLRFAVFFDHIGMKIGENNCIRPLFD